MKLKDVINQLKAIAMLHNLKLSDLKQFNQAVAIFNTQIN